MDILGQFAEDAIFLAQPSETWVWDWGEPNGAGRMEQTEHAVHYTNGQEPDTNGQYADGRCRASIASDLTSRASRHGDSPSLRCLWL
jgi:hypothetical protein